MALSQPMAAKTATARMSTHSMACGRCSKGGVEEEHEHGDGRRDGDADGRVNHADVAGLHDDVTDEADAQAEDHAEPHAADEVELALAGREPAADGAHDEARELERRGYFEGDGLRFGDHG